MSKSKATTTAPAEKQRRFQRMLSQGAREGTLIGLVALSLYLLMALVSYNPADPGWASIGHSTEASNYAGRSGAWIASLLFNFFGQMSYLFPVLLAWYAIMIFRLRDDSLEFHGPLFMLRTGGFALVILSGTSLMALYSLFGLDADAGGVVGREVSAAMVAVLNLPATTLVLVAIFLFAMTLFSGLSWIRLMDTVGALSLALLSRVAALLRPRAKTTGSGKTASPSGSAPQTPEPPVIRDRVAEPRQRWWHRLVPFRGRGGQGPRERVEPDLKEPGKALAALPVARRAEPAKGDSSATVAQDSGQKSAKSPRISPFKRKPEDPSKRAGKDKQPSLFDDDGPLPPITLLDPPDPRNKNKGYSAEALSHMSRLLEEKLADFGVSVEVVEVNPGPVITRFEIQPAAGVKVSRISNLVKDLARSLAVISVRVVEVIPGKSVVGIEIPNEEREIVRLTEVLSSRVYDDAASALTLALGNDIGGNPMVANLAKMPHLLVAGTTGSGKSVGVNAMILSMLLKATPEEVRMIMIDPKMLELSIYEGIPHLLSPVVTDMKEAANALRWCVAEMERRYRLMSALGVRNLAGYNRKLREAIDAGEAIRDPLWKPEEAIDPSEDARPFLEPLPYIVVIVDEFADMMMIVGKKVEELIARIAQKARAAGIHLILATQRPSVDVITGLIKANIPTRMSFQVSSKVDSRTILDQGGAEQLLGHGDMLYLPPGSGMPVRVHGAFVDDDEVHRVVEAWKARGEPEYVEEVLSGGDSDAVPGMPAMGGDGDSEQDSVFDEAVAFVTETRRVSISSVQRKFKIGYNRAANLVDAMESAGIVSPAGTNGAREVLAPPPPRD
ncbi:MAG: DNA translocase FtsK 4TM domain-containing protein [Oleiphilaceae bacterium]|nr:DNA translocase FtsK 4TM domain-containing protein [Oleiphilaceae bacterium]